MCTLAANEDRSFCEQDPYDHRVYCTKGAWNSLSNEPTAATVRQFIGEVLCCSDVPSGKAQLWLPIVQPCPSNTGVVMKAKPAESSVERIRMTRHEGSYHAQMAHAGVAPPLCGMHPEDGTLFMAYNGEQSLSHFLLQLPFGMDLPPEASGVLLPLALQCAEKLARVHALGIIHRDIKPANIVCGLDGEPLIIDWESADQCKEGRTVPNGQLPFTPKYAAWERILRDEVSPASDVFSLGLVFLAIFSRDYASPLEAAFQEAAIRARITDDDSDKDFHIAEAFWKHQPQKTLQSLVQPSSLLFPAMQPLLTSMLRMRPAARPSAAEVAQRLRQLLTEYVDTTGFDPDFWPVLYASICDQPTHARYAEWTDWVQEQCVTSAKPVAKPKRKWWQYLRR
jgi:serine/threonine protein kinase